MCFAFRYEPRDVRCLVRVALQLARAALELMSSLRYRSGRVTRALMRASLYISFFFFFCFVFALSSVSEAATFIIIILNRSSARPRRITIDFRGR